MSPVVEVRLSDPIQATEFQEFLNSVKAQVPIDQLYTALTGEQFERVDARPRARITWREDRTPSLEFYAQKNILWDFTDHVPGSDKPGRWYNHIDIFKKVGGAIHFGDALVKLCEYAKVEIPEKFKKDVTKESNGLPVNLGQKIREVWKLCQENMEDLIMNSHKRPLKMIKFFEERNIPFDLDFVKALNIGICPTYKLVHDKLKEQNILTKGKGDKELNIFREELGNNALVFPLYNLDGALCGFNFRQFDVKSFAEWKPIKDLQVFYNGQRFDKRPSDKYIILVEGEMNIIAYGRAVYNNLKNKSRNLQEDIEKALTIIYSTGSKNNRIDSLAPYLSKVKYLQDHDIKNSDEIFRPEDHPVFKTCIDIATQLDADDLLLADWSSLSYVSGKFDFEDFLKYNDYNLIALRDLQFISFPRYAVNVIKEYSNSIKDQDNKKQVEAKFTLLLSSKMKHYQKDIFEQICKSEFSISDNVSQAIQQSEDHSITCGEYSIDTMGRIVETVVDETNHTSHVYPKTNFYMRISNELTYYNHVTNLLEKSYEVEIVIGNSKIYKAEVSAADIVDHKKMLAFAANTASLTDLVYYDNDFRSKFFVISNSILGTIPAKKKTFIFSSLGRPFENYCCELFKTDKFCLMPKVSVINGKVTENKEFEVNLSAKNSAANRDYFEFSNLDDDTFRKAGQLFWNHLRHMHDSNIIDSLIGIIFDSCTRELQGEGIVDNAHGFPIYLAGQSGSYKTTAAIAAMSLLGKFKTQNDLLAWNGTALSLEWQLMQIGHLTHTLDDLKTEAINSKEFINFFHSIYGGSTKTRMNSSASSMSGGNKLTCSIIITSEGQAGDIPESIASRILVLRVPRSNTEIAKEYKIHFDEIYKINNNGNSNIDLMHGFFPRVISWAQQRGKAPYATSLKKWKNTFIELADVNDQKNIERPSDMISRIVAAFEQVIEFCKENDVCSKEEGNSAFNKLVEFWKKKIYDQLRRVERQSSTYKVVDLLCQMLQSEAVGVKIFNNNRWQDPKRNSFSWPIWDITYPDERGRKLIIISTNAILKYMNTFTENGYIIIKDKFEQDLKEAGIIEADQYPIPDSKGNINEKRIQRGIVIDYKKLMNMYAEIKRD